MKTFDNIPLIQGFKVAAIAAGLKKEAGALDMALIFSETEAAAAGVFTTSKVRAAPVLVSQERIAAGKARAIIANAGNANACTGTQGISDVRQTTVMLVKELDLLPEQVLVASTGVIGQPLAMDRVSGAIPGLVRNLGAGDIGQIAQAIMTTDSFPKISRFQCHAGNQTWEIQGIAKGAGMIMPDMATMLCFIMTDIAINPDDLQQALSFAVQGSFNRITVDGDTSTNDTVLVLANGMAGNGPLSDEEMEQFTAGLKQVMVELARMIVQDGEGATKVVDVVVKGANSPGDAILAARTIGNSSLVKTAFYGQDPNWGRIMGALGRSDIQMQEDMVNIWVNDIQIVAGGLGKGVSAEKAAAEHMKDKSFVLTVDLQQGNHEDRIITCDLTHEYVSINADYRT